MTGGDADDPDPRWIQLVGLPILALIALLIVGKVFHAVFLFIVAGADRAPARAAGARSGATPDSARLLYRNRLPQLCRRAGRRVDRRRRDRRRPDAVGCESDRQLPYDRKRTAPADGFRAGRRPLQIWLDTHHLERIDVKRQGTDFAQSIKGKDVEKYTTDVIDFLRGAAISVFQLIFALVLILVVSIYMLLDMSRLKARVDRRFPPSPGQPGLIVQMERAVAGYVRGQVLLSLIIGTSAGVGMWVLGTTGLVPGADKYAVVFGAWVAVMELIPYLGPWLGAIPPIVYALVVHPLSAVWVALLFLGIHQIEGHVVVPNVMGSALRLHPLLVIFGLLAGGELYGLPGILVALPFLAVMRAMWEFFGERLQFESWKGGELPAEVEVTEKRPVKPVPPEEPPEAKVAP
jgi:predicted PurR-regulated permease PerM